MIESYLRNFLRNERCDSTKVKELIFTNRMFNRNETLAQITHSHATRAYKRRQRKSIEDANVNERRVATQGRLLMIIIIILVLSNFHSCILADKPNVAQLTKTNCREWIWTSLSMSVCMCVSMSCMCKCVYMCVKARENGREDEIWCVSRYKLRDHDVRSNCNRVKLMLFKVIRDVNVICIYHAHTSSYNILYLLLRCRVLEGVSSARRDIAFDPKNNETNQYFYKKRR